MISFCIPFRTDDGHRETAFQFITQTLKKEWPDAEVIVADTGSEVFSRSGSRNMAAAKANGDWLVFLDADSFVPLYQLRQGIAAVTDYNDFYAWCFPYDFYYSLTAPGSLKFMTSPFLDVDENDIVYVFPGPDPFDRPPAVGGCVVVRRAAFRRVQGYDERFVGWSFEDRAFAYSLEAFYGVAPRIAGGLYHLWHPEIASDQFNQPHMEANRALCSHYEKARSNRVAMDLIIDSRAADYKG